MTLVAFGALGYQVVRAGITGCETSWATATGGLWTDSAKWSNGVPSSAGTSNDDACITVAGTYSVILSGPISATANTLNLGGTSGTQTLKIEAVDVGGGAHDASLTLLNGGVNNLAGRIELTHFGPNVGPTARLTVSNGTFGNFGTISSEVGGVESGRRLQGNIVNFGSVLINANTIYTNSGLGGPRTFSNLGFVTIATAKTLRIPADGSATFANSGGVVHGVGTGQLLIDDDNADNTYNQGDGTTAGTTPVLLRNAALNYTGTGASKITVRGVNNTLSGNIGADQDLIIGATDFCSGTEHATMTAAASFTSAGDITLTHEGGCTPGDATLVVSNGTLTNTGTIQSAVGTPADAGERILKGNITNSSPTTVDIDTDTIYTNNGLASPRTFLNQGSLDIATGKTFRIPSNGSATFTNGTGGSVNAAGTGQLLIDDDNADIIFNQGAGTTTGSAPVVLRNAALTYTGTGASSIIARGTGNTLSGNIGADQNLIIGATDFCSGTEHATMTAAASFTSAGDIVLTHEGGCTPGDATLVVSNGTLTNTGTIHSAVGTPADAGERTLKGNITNSSSTSVGINTDTIYTNSGLASPRTFLNQGSLDIATGKTFRIPSNGSATFTNGTGGSVNGAGTGQLLIDDDNADNTFNQGGGTTTGTTPVLLRNAALTYTAPGSSKITVRGIGNTLSGNIGVNEDLIIGATDSCGGAESSTITAGNSLTNAGDITLTHEGGCASGDAKLAVSSGTLTNTGKIISEIGSPANAGDRILQGNMLNDDSGTVDINSDTAHNTATSFTNEGSVDIGPAATFNKTNNYVQAAGTTSVDSLSFLTASGEVQVTGGTLKGIGTVGSAVVNTGGTVSPGGSPGILTINGTFSQSGTGKLVTEIDGTTPGTEYDRLVVTGQATLGGTLEIVTGGGFDPNDGDSFQILTASPRTGTFDTVTGFGFSPSKFYEVGYNAGDVTLDVHELADRTVTLKSSSNKVRFGRPFKLTGAIESSDPTCEQSQDVDIMRKIGGESSFTLLQTVESDGDGKFKLPQTADKSATYRAEVEADSDCLADNSPNVEVQSQVRVAIVTSDAKVKKQEKFTLTATVTPCPGHSGMDAKLFRRVGRTGKRGFFLEKKGLNNKCKVSFTRKINQPEQFKVQAVPPPNHKDHHQGVSAWLPIAIDK